MLSTAEDAAALVALGRTVVEEKLAACVSVVPGLISVYLWQGNIEEDGEALAIIKTTADRYPALEARWRELHPYDVPELLALPVVGGLPEYLAWLADSTGLPDGR